MREQLTSPELLFSILTLNGLVAVLWLTTSRLRLVLGRKRVAPPIQAEVPIQSSPSDSENRLAADLQRLRDRHGVDSLQWNS